MVREMIRLHNKLITVKVDKLGAEIKSITANGREIMWQGEEGWKRTAPTLFPFCGAFINGKYTYKGEEYECEKHGFARTSEFEVEKKSKKSATLLLKSSEETLKCYPFEFEFRVIFTISGKSLIIEYDVKNKTDGEMYFSVGSHEGYICKGGIENYDVIFPRRETLDTYIINENGITQEKMPILKHGKILPLLEGYLENDSLVIDNMASRRIILRNRINGERIKVEFPGFDYFVIWSIPEHEYICLEPWAGFPATTESIEERRGIIRLKKGRRKKLMHKITVLENL